MVLPLMGHLLTLLLGAQATHKDSSMGARYLCPPLGVVSVWRSDAGPRSQKARGIVWYKGVSYSGYWDGGTLQFFTPDLKTHESPWLVFSRTGNPRWELFLGKKSWLVDDGDIYKKHALCSFKR